MENQFQYWLKEEHTENGLERTYYKTGIWQTRPFGCIEITQEEYESR